MGLVFSVWQMQYSLVLWQTGPPPWSLVNRHPMGKPTMLPASMSQPPSPQTVPPPRRHALYGTQDWPCMPCALPSKIQRIGRVRWKAWGGVENTLLVGRCATRVAAPRDVRARLSRTTHTPKISRKGCGGLQGPALHSQTCRPMHRTLDRGCGSKGGETPPAEIWLRGGRKALLACPPCTDCGGKRLWGCTGAAGRVGMPSCLAQGAEEATEDACGSGNFCL